MSEAPGTLPPTVTASVDERRARQRRMLWLFVALSFGVHVGLVAGWLFAPSPSKPAIDLDEAVVKTRLVKLGKERPPDWLPRIDAAPPPPKHHRPQPQHDKPKDQPKHESKEKPASAADVLKDFEEKNESPSDIIKDRLGKATDEGMKEGDKEGQALTGEMKKTYFNSLIAYITKHMEVSSTLTDEERIRLKAVLTIKVDGDGNVLSARIDKSSGSSIFDNDVLTAAKRSSPVPAPPPPLKALLESGVGINFCPVSCS